jgi:ribosomal 30S subunit maturation factor RimM
MEDASRFKEKAIFVWREIIKKFNPDLILESDVIGCNVIDIVDNKTIGKIVEVWYLPANDV